MTPCRATRRIERSGGTAPRRPTRCLWPRVALLWVTAAGPLACGSDGSVQDSATHQQHVIYDSDDRLELYEASENLRRFGEESVAALVDESELLLDADPHARGRQLYAAPSMASRFGVCETERFSTQPSAASCTGVLAAPDLILTAGHCVGRLDCAKTSVVFGYRFAAAGVPSYPAADDWYHCAEIVTYEVPSVLDSLDYGWLRLDRPVDAAKTPVRLERTARAVSASGQLSALDHGAGLPMKALPGAVAVDGRPELLDYFVADFDAFVGSSGAPVLDEAGVVRGILASGAADFAASDVDCAEVAHLPRAAARETVTYSFRALAGLCDELPSAAVCEDAAATKRAGCSVHVAPIPATPFVLVVVVGLAGFGRRRHRSRAHPR
jgi:hypothetical protein